jgi:iron(III) transport system substrate-binding protein
MPTRRLVLGSLAALAAGGPARADLGMLEAAARREGGLTWYISQVDAETAEQMGRAFTRRYPGVTVTVIRTTGEVAYQKVLAEHKNQSPQCDVYSVTDIGHYPALKARGLLARYEAENAAGLAPEVRGLGDPGYFYPTTGTLLVMTYNTQRVAEDAAPRRWTDLLDAKWRGKVGLGHPGFSSGVAIWAVALRKRYGWDYFKQLADNRPQIGRSGNDTIAMLNSGERQVAYGALSTSLLSADKGNPIGIRYPEDGAVLAPGPAAVLADAPHPNAGRLFLEWLLSEDFATLSAGFRQDPVRPGIALRPGARPLAEIPVIGLSIREIADGVPDVIEMWRDTFGV